VECPEFETPVSIYNMMFPTKRELGGTNEGQLTSINKGNTYFILNIKM
jgi:hypothetical protein